MDTMTVINDKGKQEVVELILTVSKGKKKYLLYQNSNKEIYASYILDNDDKLYNDLTDDEYKMLEDIYKQGLDMYDK